MATIYTFHSHAQFVGNDEDKMFELIEHFFKTFSQSMFWSAGNKSTYVYTAGLMLRKAPASKIKTLINAYVLKFPEWLCASSLWYSNLPEAREALAKLTRNGPYHMYKMTAKLFLRKDRPTDEGFNELPKSHGDIEIQKTVELLARWFINGDLNCIQKVLDEKLGQAVKPYMEKFLDEEYHLRTSFKEAKSVAIVPEALEMVLEAKRYDTFLKELIRKWV